MEESPPAGDRRWQELQRIWKRDLKSGSAAALVRALRNNRQKVVVEWGFPVNDQNLAFVRSMKENGVRVVWFECPDEVARERFANRGTVPNEAFDRQTASIREEYARIMEEIEPEVVDVLNPDGSPRSPEELCGLILDSETGNKV